MAAENFRADQVPIKEVSVDRLKRAVEAQHGGTATLIQVTPVDERDDGKLIWRGVVHVFELTGHRSANRVYAWSRFQDDGKRRFFAMLHIGPVTGPEAAVRATIVAKDREHDPQ